MPAEAAAAMEALSVQEKDWPALVADKQPYYARRVELFSKYKARHDAALQAARAAAVAIRVILPDGTERQGVKGATTPLEIAAGLSKSLAKKAIVAKVDGAVWDLARPLEGDCTLQILGFEDADGKEVRGCGCGCVGRQAGGAREGCVRRRAGGPQAGGRELAAGRRGAHTAPLPHAAPAAADVLALERARAGPGAGAGVWVRPHHWPRAGGGRWALQPCVAAGAARAEQHLCRQGRSAAELPSADERSPVSFEEEEVCGAAAQIYASLGLLPSNLKRLFFGIPRAPPARRRASTTTASWATSR